MESNTNAEISNNEQTQNITNEEGSSITSYVSQDVVKQLLEMGYSKNVAEKSCFFNQNILEKAIEWIYEHQNDNDFEEELKIVGQKENSNLTPEEIKLKAKELQEYARKRYVQKQKELEEEQEKNRVRQSKF